MSRILTDEEINKIYDRWLHEPKEPKFLNWTTYLTTETARLVREETIGMVNNLLINTDYCIGQYKIDGCDDVDYVLADKEDGDPIDSGQNMTSETLKKQVRAETLKEVGKWFLNKYSEGDWVDYFQIMSKLSQGVMP
jgi:hypothetical protein